MCPNHLRRQYRKTQYVSYQCMGENIFISYLQLFWVILWHHIARDAHFRYFRWFASKMNNAHPFCSWVHLKCSSTRNTISIGMPNRALWIAGKWNDFSSPFRCNISFHLCILCILFPFLIISYCYSMIILVPNNNVKICNKINRNSIFSYSKKN